MRFDLTEMIYGQCYTFLSWNFFLRNFEVFLSFDSFGPEEQKNGRQNFSEVFLSKLEF